MTAQTGTQSVFADPKKACEKIKTHASHCIDPILSGWGKLRWPLHGQTKAVVYPDGASNLGRLILTVDESMPTIDHPIQVSIGETFQSAILLKVDNHSTRPHHERL